MNLSHCQYCGAPADVRVYVKAINSSVALRARTGSSEFSVASCMAHAGSAVARASFTHCVETGASFNACPCFWCVGERIERTAARNAAILHDANHDCREAQR